MIKIIAILLLIPSIALAKHIHYESYYQKIDCDKRGGLIEYRLDNGKRVDCLTDKYAIEHDFAVKWPECFSQALYYAMKTNKKAMCVLILESKKSVKHLNYAKETKKHYKLPLKIRTIKNY